MKKLLDHISFPSSVFQ